MPFKEADKRKTPGASPEFCNRQIELEKLIRDKAAEKVAADAAVIVRG